MPALPTAPQANTLLRTHVRPAAGYEPSEKPKTIDASATPAQEHSNERRVSNTLFKDADLRQAQLSDTDFAHVTFINCNFRGQTLESTRFIDQCQFKNCAFDRIRAKDLVLRDSTIEDGSATGIITTDLTASSVTCVGTDFSGAHMSRSHLSDSQFTDITADATTWVDLSLTNSQLKPRQSDRAGGASETYVNATLKHAQLTLSERTHNTLRGITTDVNSRVFF